MAGPSPEAQKLRYDDHKARGLCVRCHLRATHGTMCAAHHEARKKAKRTYNQTFYAKKKAAGLCAYCREPATDGVVCARHRAYLRQPRPKRAPSMPDWRSM